MKALGNQRLEVVVTHHKEQMCSALYAEVVSLSADGKFLATSHFRDEKERGSINLYKFEGEKWINAGEIIVGDTDHLYFGNALAMSGGGEVLVVSGDGNQEVPGTVKTYNYSNGVWKLSGHVGGGTPGYHFGSSVSISRDGNTLAVGERSSQYGGTTYVYKYCGNEWKKMGPDILGVNSQGDFGVSVALSGDGNVVAIGANAFTDKRQGCVTIYYFENDEWIIKGEIIQGLVGEFFGTAVSISYDGSVVAIGSPGGNNGRGRADIYTFSEGKWVQKGQPFHGQHPDAFLGNALALSSDGNIFLLASDGFDNTKGIVSLYIFNGFAWVQTDCQLRGSAEKEYFGVSVSLSSDGTTFASANYKVLNESVVYRLSYKFDHKIDFYPENADIDY